MPPITSNPAIRAARESETFQRTGELQRTQINSNIFANAENRRLRDQSIALDTARRTPLMNAGVTSRPRPAPQDGQGGGLRRLQAQLSPAQVSPQVAGGAGLSGGSIPPTQSFETPGQERRRVATQTVQNLANTPGGGAEAQQLSLGEFQRQQDVLSAVMDLASQGKPDEAKIFAEQSGMPVPPQISQLLTDARMAGGVKMIFETAESTFPGAINAKRRWEFIQVEMRGFMDAINNGQRPEPIAGRVAETVSDPSFVAPAAQPVDGRFQIFPQQTGGAVVFNQNSGTIDRLTPEETGGSFSTSRSATSRPTVFQTKMNAWLALHPGDQQGALDFATSRAQMTRVELRKAATSMVLQQDARSTFPGEMTPEVLEQKVLEMESFLMAASEGAPQPTPVQRPSQLLAQQAAAVPDNPQQRDESVGGVPGLITPDNPLPVVDTQLPDIPAAPELTEQAGQVPTRFLDSANQAFDAEPVDLPARTDGSIDEIALQEGVVYRVTQADGSIIFVRYDGEGNFDHLEQQGP